MVNNHIDKNYEFRKKIERGKRDINHGTATSIRISVPV